MAAGLKSASINQILKLALKTIVLALIIFWLRRGGFTAGSSIIFILTFAVFYVRPPLGNAKFLPSALTLAIIPFFVPVASGAAEAMLVAGWGVVLFLILSTKNLVLLKRKNLYRVAHFAMVAILSFLLIERFSFMTQAVIFTAMLFIFREFYLKFADNDKEKKTLIAATESLIIIEIAWILSFVSIDIFMGTALITLSALIFHDTTLHRMHRTLDKQIVIRNGIIFGTLAFIIIIFSLKEILL